MAEKRDSKLSKQLLRELPYNIIYIVYAHGQFNNSLPSQIPTKKFLERHILRELDFHFNIIAGYESRINDDINDFNSNIPNYYNFEFAPTPVPLLLEVLECT